MDSFRKSLDMTPGGFPHSEIPGSQLVCSSPRLIAAYHVLHRLLTPRHPPFALRSLISARSPIPIAELTPDGCSLADDCSAFTRFVSLNCQRSIPCGGLAGPLGRRPTLPFGFRAGEGVRGVRFRDPRSAPRHAGRESGGADRDRTGDTRLAKPVLSQLSYSPARVSFRRTPIEYPAHQLPGGPR